MFDCIRILDYSRPLSDRAKSRKVVGPYMWSPSKPGTGRGFYQSSRGLEMDRAGSTFDLRLEDANEFLGSSRLSQITGYFCDDFGHDTLKPIVARLPRSRGFLAGWTMGEGMCASIGSEIYEAAETAARAAHGMAEYDADEMQSAREEDDEDESD